MAAYNKRLGTTNAVCLVAGKAMRGQAMQGQAIGGQAMRGRLKGGHVVVGCGQARCFAGEQVAGEQVAGELVSVTLSDTRRIAACTLTDSVVCSSAKLTGSDVLLGNVSSASDAIRLLILPLLVARTLGSTQQSIVLRTLLDSGASHSFISEQAVLENHLDMSERQEMQVALADGSSVVSRYICPLRMQLGQDIETLVPCQVVQALQYPVVFGIDRLRQWNPQVDWNACTVKLSIDGSERVVAA